MGADAGAVGPAPELWWGSSPEARAAAAAAEEEARLKKLADTPTRMCLQLEAKGGLCQTQTTQWFEGIGWRCRHHRPAAPAPERRAPNTGGLTPTQGVPANPPDAPPNDGRIASVEDANAMIAWATRELALGRIPESRSRGVINGSNRYIRNINEIQGKERMDKMEKGLRDAGLLK